MARRFWVFFAFLLLILSFEAKSFVYAEGRSRYSYKTYSDTQELNKFLELRVKWAEETSAAVKDKINFAIAEYYFKTNAITDARNAFEEYVKQSEQGISTLIANGYLYQMAKISGKEERIETLKKEIFKDPFILLFNKYKTLQYKSYKFDNHYEVHYYVDKIEIFLNGSLFVEINA